MRHQSMLAFCVMFLFTGCASKGKPIPVTPVNGICGYVQNACLLGTPSSTGDTTPPYGWMCLGRLGGTSDPCSVPTAKIELGEIFAGQHALEEKAKATESMRGMITLLDFTLDHPNCEPPYCHAHVMKRYILDMGIPEENLYVTPNIIMANHLFVPSGDTQRQTLVFAAPFTLAFDILWSQINTTEQGDFLVVTGAGNSEGVDGVREQWYPDHPWWVGSRWERSMAFLETGKVLLAKYAAKGHGGTIIPVEANVKCGLAKEWCYSIMVPNNQNVGTSGASVNLSALTFYLFQLWETPREVVNTLNACAEDVGEPGIDEEYGRGIVSVVCDTVRNREVGLVTDSMRTFSVSPALDQMTAMSHMTSLRTTSISGRSFEISSLFRPFYTVRGYDLDTVTGHVGGQFSLKETDLFVSGGSDRTPLGIHSPLLHAVRIPFMEFGVRRPLFRQGGHHVSLLGTHGYSAGSGLSAHIGHLSTQYEYASGFTVFSLRAGYRMVGGSIGIPGYREARASPVPFMSHTPEVRFSFSLSR